MTDDKPDAADLDDGSEESHTEVVESDPLEQEAPPPSASEAEIDDPLAEAERQVAGLKDQVLRAQAEMENVRRRAARDVENAHKYALERFTSDLLPVLDSLEKAVEASGESAGEAAGAIKEGVELSLKLFLTTLEKAGVIQVDPHGEPFDPQLHEAMAMVPNPDTEPNSVIEVMQKGYTLNGRLVRAAKVVVSAALSQDG
jgi:molecular chaperone GrpE